MSELLDKNKKPLVGAALQAAQAAQAAQPPVTQAAFPTKYPRLARKAKQAKRQTTGPATPEDIHVLACGLNYHWVDFYINGDGTVGSGIYDYCYPGCPYILNQDDYDKITLPWTEKSPEPIVVLGTGTTIYLAVEKALMEESRKKALTFHYSRLGNNSGTATASVEKVEDLLPAGEYGSV